LVEDQVTVEVLPDVMLAGLADNVTVGFRYGPGTATWAKDGASSTSESAVAKANVQASRVRAQHKERKAKLKLTPFELKFTVLEFSMRSN
jgi:hypothetical protein